MASQLAMTPSAIDDDPRPLAFYDVHAHLADERISDQAQEILAASAAAGVRGIVAAAARRQEWDCIEALAEESIVYGALGIHPFFLDDWGDETAEELAGRCGRNQQVRAVGEIGLDFQHGRDQAARQIEVLTAQLRVAAARQLPVILHNRKSWSDFFGLLRDLGIDELRGVCHHFTGSREIARKALDLGLYLSFCGPLTYPNAHRLKAMARFVPADRMLTETDSPDLPGAAYRGQMSSPPQVRDVVEEIARVRQVSTTAVAAQIAENFEALFGP